MRSKTLALSLALISSAFTFHAVAQSSSLGLWVNSTEFASTHQELGGAGSADFDFSRKTGYGVDYDMPVSKSLSVDTSAQFLRGESSAVLNFPSAINFDQGEMRATIFSAALLWRPALFARFRPYVGGGAAYLNQATLRTPPDGGIPSTTVDFEPVDSLTYLAEAGAEYVLTPRFGLAVDGRYSPHKVEREDGAGRHELNLQPLTVSVGLRVHF
jgi:opacity protein-like surface antigen